jgi:tetratricopeptide (TPR) repeat protein
MSGDSSRVLARRATESGEAYELYLQGRYHLAKQTFDDWRKGVAAFERAIALDSKYALAHAGLADAYVLASNVYLPPAEAMPRARDAATRVLDLDPELAEGHVALGQVRLWYEWDRTGAESEFRRAVEINRGYAPAHYQRGFALLVAGRFADAEKEMQEAQRLDPLSLPLARDIGSVHYFARQFDQAEAQYRKALELDPSFKSLHAALATCYVEMGRPADALAEIELTGDAAGASRRLSLLAYVLARSGDVTGAKGKLAELIALQSRGEYVSPVAVARVYAAMGLKDEAFEWLEKGLAARADTLVWCRIDPRLDALRSDPRFDDLLRRIGV